MAILDACTPLAQVATKYLAPLVHSRRYIDFLEGSLPRTYERAVTLAAAAGTDAGGLVWEAGGRRSSRQATGEHARNAPAAVVDSSVSAVEASREGAGDAGVQAPPRVGDLETFLSAESMMAARHAAGAVCEGVDLVLSGKYAAATPDSPPARQCATPRHCRRRLALLPVQCPRAGGEAGLVPVPVPPSSMPALGVVL